MICTDECQPVCLARGTMCARKNQVWRILCVQSILEHVPERGAQGHKGRAVATGPPLGPAVSWPHRGVLWTAMQLCGWEWLWVWLCVFLCVSAYEHTYMKLDQ